MKYLKKMPNLILLYYILSINNNFFSVALPWFSW
jgi:hypothetical protein